MTSQHVWLLLIFVGLVHGVPMKKDRLAKREVESLHFGNHQNKIPADGSMADAQLLESYMTAEKRALKDEDDDSSEEKGSEEKLPPLKKRVMPLGMEGWENQYPSYYDYYNNPLNEYRAAPAISPEDNLPYVPTYRRRRSSPIASAKLHRKKKFMPPSMSHFLRQRRSAGYDYMEPMLLEEILNEAVVQNALEELEDEAEDNESLDRYEFKYPYYPGMVEYTTEEAPEEEYEPEDYSLSPDEMEGPPEEQAEWMKMNPAEIMQVRRRSEPPRKRYSFPMIPMPGQKKKRDQIDSPMWGKIENKRTLALKKRQQRAGQLYALAQLLSQSPEESLQMFRRDNL